MLVHPSGRKTFTLAYRRKSDHKLRWMTLATFPTIGISEARRQARIELGKAAAGGDPQGDKVSQRASARAADTLAKVHQAYVASVKDTNRSWEQSARLIKNHVMPSLGKRKIQGHKPCRYLEDHGQSEGSAILANQTLAASSAVFSYAFKRDLIAINPCKGVDRHETKASTRYLSNDEIRQCWSLFDDLGLLPSTALKVGLLTAQRPGEISHMRWEHIAKDSSGAFWWNMPGEATDGWLGTKNKHDHQIYLSASVVDLLRELELHTHGFVFASIRPGKCIEIPVTKSIWQKARIERFRPHDLRGTAATAMYTSGVPRDHISLVLNHVEGGITKKYLKGKQLDHKRAALELWATELMAILAGTGKTDQTADVVSIRTRSWPGAIEVPAPA